jgi:hypothetical protein
MEKAEKSPELEVVEDSSDEEGVFIEEGGEEILIDENAIAEEDMDDGTLCAI